MIWSYFETVTVHTKYVAKEDKNISERDMFGHIQMSNYMPYLSQAHASCQHELEMFGRFTLQESNTRTVAELSLYCDAKTTETTSPAWIKASL